MINIKELAVKIKEQEYNEEQLEAKLCQDIILYLISKSRFKYNITIKGGVVIRDLSNSNRRATLDLDFDLIRYPLTDNGIIELVEGLNNIDNITLKITKAIEPLKHQDYNGKRVFIEIKDSFSNTLTCKLDIGVHKHLSIDQDEYCFELSSSNESITLFINSKEQILVEKLKSLIRFGIFSTRFKDIYDIHFLSNIVDKNKLLFCLEDLIFNDESIRTNNINDITNRLEKIFTNKIYLKNLATSKRNWLDIKDDIILSDIINFFKTLWKGTVKK